MSDTIPIRKPDPKSFERVTDLCPSPHLGSDDLTRPDGSTFEIDLTIDRWDVHEVGEKKEMKSVIYFRERDRSLVVNRSIMKMIKRLHGNDIGAIVGKRITLYVQQDVQRPGGIIGPALRVKDRVPGEASTPSAKREAQKQTA